MSGKNNYKRSESEMKTRKLILTRIIFSIIFGVCFVLPVRADDAGKTSDMVTLNVKDVDLVSVLNAFSQQTGKNIVIGKDVSGYATFRLADVQWEDALNLILRPYGYAYQKIGDTILVNSMEKISKYENEEPLISKVFQLNYLDASDIKELIESHLSKRGHFAIINAKGQKGWEFGGGSDRADAYGSGHNSTMDSGKRERVKKDENLVKSKIFIVTDVSSSVAGIEDILKSVDIKPRQILIEAKFMEVDRDKLKDVGIDFGTGPTGAENAAITTVNFNNGSFVGGGNALGSQVTPSNFIPLTTGLSGQEPFNTGFSFLLKHLTGTQFEVLLHMLEEDGAANILSAPRVVTLNNQEASILVGTKYPIVTANITGQVTAITSTSLDYYEDIGIQLNVVPQVCADNQVSMIIHPAVTSQNGVVTSKTDTNVILAQYPIIDSRETETQVMVKSGETIVIGGLLKDVRNKMLFKIPILGDLPFIGRFFCTRLAEDSQKIDLLIFITATIVSSEDISAPIEPVFQGLGKDKIKWGKEFNEVKKDGQK